MKHRSSNLRPQEGVDFPNTLEKRKTKYVYDDVEEEFCKLANGNLGLFYSQQTVYLLTYVHHGLQIEIGKKKLHLIRNESVIIFAQ